MGPLSVHLGSNLALWVKSMNFLLSGQWYSGIIFWYRTPLSVICGACNKGKRTPPPDFFWGKWPTSLFNVTIMLYWHAHIKVITELFAMRCICTSTYLYTIYMSIALFFVWMTINDTVLLTYLFFCEKIQTLCIFRAPFILFINP